VFLYTVKIIKESPWGIDEERSKNLAPILEAAGEHYEKGIEYLEKVLKFKYRSDVDIER